jgi:WD40 repeat protein
VSPTSGPGQDKHDRNIFLVSGHAKPNCVITIWDLKKQVFVKQLSGHTDDITAISSLQDGHTLFTGSRSGTTLVFNLTKKKPIKTFQSLANSPVTCIYTFNDLSKIAIGYENGEINVCGVVYEMNMAEKIAECVTCDMQRTFKIKSGVHCINESHVNPNTLITGHKDGVLRIWDCLSGSVLKEFAINKTAIMGLLVIENPFGYNVEDNYHIITFGETGDDIFFNQPKSSKHFNLRLGSAIQLTDPKVSPRVQMFRRNKNEIETGINLVTFANSAEHPPKLLMVSIM